MKRLAVVLSLLSLTTCRYNPPGQCQSVADCQPGERCASSGLCLTGCDTDLDCDDWERCTGRNGECVPLDGSCNRESDCEYWENCSRDHFCEVAGNSCVAAADCTEWQFCSDVGICLLAGGRCTTATDCVGPMSACNEDHRCVTQTGSGTGTGTGGGFGSGQVLIFGAIGSKYAIAPLNSPGSPRVGFDHHLSTSFINPKGELVYLDGWIENWNQRVRIFKEDDTTQGYPANPLENDEVVPTTCGPGDDVAHFEMNPSSGKIIHRCLGSNTYYDDEGREVMKDAAVYAWNGGGHLLFVDKADHDLLKVFDPRGDTVKVVSGPEQPFRAVRADDNTFLVVEFGSKDLWRIENDGSAKVVKTYGGNPSGVSDYSECVLDKSNNLFCHASDGKDAVIKFPASGSTGVIVYSTKNAPSGSNSPFVHWSTGSLLITSP